MAKLPALADVRVGVVGLGYVGLPVAAFMGRHFPVTGWDINPKRISELQRGVDRTGEIAAESLTAANIEFAPDHKAMADCNFYIVTVPTPIDEPKRPDL